MRIDESMIKILGAIFYVKLPICFKSCYVSQRNPYYRIYTGKLQCYESADLRLLARFPGISNLNNYTTIILAVFQILFYLELENRIMKLLCPKSLI